MGIFYARKKECLGNYLLLRATTAAAPNPAMIPINGAGDDGVGVSVVTGFTDGVSTAPGVSVGVGVTVGSGVGVGVSVSQMEVP